MQIPLPDPCPLQKLSPHGDTAERAAAQSRPMRGRKPVANPRQSLGKGA